MKVPKSIRGKIILFIIIVSVYPMVLMGVIAAYNYDNIIKERFISSAKMNMSHISTSINSDIGDMGDSILNMLQDPNFYDKVYNQPNIEIGSFDSFNLSRNLQDYLSTIVFAKKHYDSGGLYFYGNEQHVYYAEEAGLISESAIPLNDMIDAIKNHKGYKFYHQISEGRLQIYITQQVYNNDTLQPIGMVYYRVDEDYLVNLFDRTFVQEDATMLLYTSDGLMLAREGTLAVETMINRGDYYLKESDVYVDSRNKEEYYIINEAVNELDLTLLTVVSSDALTQDSRKVMDLVFILYLISVPIIAVAAYFLNGNIVKPIKLLANNMKTFEEGNFDTRIEETRKDEFGYIYHAFNDMTSNINTLVNDVYIQELARKDAEIAALQEQINPHFLYNTLESINWRAQLAGEQDIALMIQALSKLMDGNINRDNEKYITVEREIEYMNQYMFLVKMRYEDQLEYTFELEEGISDALVPKLIVQPLLENAVKHGIEPMGGGVVTLSCYQVDESLRIEVKDSGHGMSQVVKQQIQSIIDYETMNVHNQHDKDRSIGFENVTRRIKLIYGNEATIFFDSRENVGTTITITIPLRRDRSKGQVTDDV